MSVPKLDPSPNVHPSPHQHLSLWDSTSIIVGIIIGSSIYGSMPTIASQVPSFGWLMAVWILGGVFTLIGALCYAEMATAYPKAGGDYVFLTEAFGSRLGFLFAWSQFWIIRPGSLSIFAFLYAYYANRVFPLSESSHPLLLQAVGSVVVLTVINLLGVRAGKTTQNLLTAVKYVGLLAVVVAGLAASAPAAIPNPAKPPPLDLGFAMIFIFFAYSGWNEMAYVSSEVRDPRKNILRALVLGTLAVSALYIAVNLASVHALGLQGLREGGQDVAAKVLERTRMPNADKIICVLVCITALGGINGMIFTGARIFYAVGNDHRLFSWLGRWNSLTDTPARPIIIQAVAAVAMILGFGWQEDPVVVRLVLSNETAARILKSLAWKQHSGFGGFQDAVAFTSPTFWLFLYFVGLAFFVLHVRRSADDHAYRVPLYPLLPILFCLSNAYMFFKSLDYAISTTPWSLLGSIVVLAIGAALIFWAESREQRA